MRLELYDKVEDVEVSLSSCSEAEFSFRSEIKNLTFNFSIVKYLKLNDLLEKVIQRERLEAVNMVGKVLIPMNLLIQDSQNERLEVHLRLIDEHSEHRDFCFNLGQNWKGGGKIFVRLLGE